MRIEKRGQVTAHQVFYILLIIIFSFVLLLGYAFIKDVGNKGEKATFILLKSKLANDVNTLGYGNMRIETYRLPEGMDKICFSEPKETLELTCPSCMNATEVPIVTNAIDDKVKENVFLIGDGLSEAINVGDFTIGCCQFFCVNAAKGKVKLRLEKNDEKTLIKNV